jgi:hypothetical protein
MSFKSKVLAATATLTLVGGVGTAGVLTAGTASAATPSCGPLCVNTFSYEYGTHVSPNFVVDTYRQGNKVGQKIILFRTSNADPAEDFTVDIEGTVADFYAAGLISATTALHYGCIPQPDVGANFPDCPFSVTGVPANSSIKGDANDNTSNYLAFEQEYAPYGVDSGLCVGVASTAFQDEGVTLQPCGVSAKTVWILDTLDQQFTDAWAHGYFPLINGSNTNFSEPFVLTYPNDGYPTDMPRPQLVVENLTGFSFQPGNFFGTGANDNQLWSATFGELR